MPRHSKQQRQWMSGAPSPDDNRDGIDSNPSRGALAAIIVIVACVALAILVLHALPYDVWKDIANFVTGNEITMTAGSDADAASKHDADDVNTSANGTPDGTQNGKSSNANSTAADTSGNEERTATVDDGDMTQPPSKSGQVVKGNGWSITLPQRWTGNTIISYSDSGNRAIVRTRGNGSGTDENGNANWSDKLTPYLLLIERASGSEPDTYGDIGSQLAYYVTSSDGKWHLEVWTVNAVWLVRQDDRTPYESTSGQVWDMMCDLLTGGNVNSADAALALGDDDMTIGTGEIDYLAETLKPETQTD